MTDEQYETLKAARGFRILVNKRELANEKELVAYELADMGLMEMVRGRFFCKGHGIYNGFVLTDAGRKALEEVKGEADEA